jgi:hypothetical protein
MANVPLTNQIILLLGNYMNAFGPHGTYVEGFRIDFLSKINNTRTADNKMTLLQYIAATLQKKAADVLEFKETFPHVEKASKGTVAWCSSRFRLCHLDGKFAALCCNVLSVTIATVS